MCDRLVKQKICFCRTQERKNPPSLTRFAPDCTFFVITQTIIDCLTELDQPALCLDIHVNHRFILPLPSLFRILVKSGVWDFAVVQLDPLHCDRFDESGLSEFHTITKSRHRSLQLLARWMLKASLHYSQFVNQSAGFSL